MTCDKHIWRSSVNNAISSSRRQTNGCPFCFGLGPSKKVCVCMSLASKYPNIAKQWDEENAAPGPTEIKIVDNFKTRIN